MPDLSNADLCEVRQDGSNPKVRLKIKVRNGDETGWMTVELETVLANVYQLGFDPTTGLPMVNVQTANVARTVECDPGVRKKSASAKAPDRGYG